LDRATTLEAICSKVGGAEFVTVIGFGGHRDKFQNPSSKLQKNTKLQIPNRP